MARRTGKTPKKSTIGKILHALSDRGGSTKTACQGCGKPVSGGTHHPQCGKRAHYVAPPRRDEQAQQAAFEQSLRRAEVLNQRALDLGL